MAMVHLLRFTTGSVLLLFLLVTNIAAAEPCDTVVGRLATLEGKVEVQRTGSPNWQTGVLGGDLCQGDTVRAGARSRATIALINQAVLRVDQNTAMRLDNISGVTEERSVLSLLQGAFQSFSRKPRGFEVNTPYLNGSIEGTEFVFRVKDGQSELTVLEGLVVASNSQGKVSVSGGESAVGEQGKAPSSRTVVRPRDAVQWSLYYPPVMATDANARAADPEAQASLQNAASLLYVGRVDEAQANIDKALKLDPNAGLAYALRAVINVVQNNNDQALADGNQAVALSPDSSAAKIALSYAQQAAFDIPAARNTLQQAVQQQPDDALALARLAELQLMLGDRKQARETARQAAVLDPKLARTQMILGFTALAEFRNEEAITAFEHAIDLSSAEPMAHLGLGLAKISNGELEAGGRDIEVAVALDSNSALLRAYLGKTYFEERRAPLDSDQFGIAKQLDPNDPTAYFYNGIALQTENRPVEAIGELERSADLNDNRLVYRSRLLLDKDRAARGTSIARAYKDLGMEQLGVNKSSQALTLDPANASAHRFLSDNYRGQRRREFSRVSELYQAQMLQDINVNPVQPSISTGNLNIVTLGGPASPGFNEFTPLFQQNEVQVDVSAAGGNNGTYAGEAVVTVLKDRYSLSLGGLSYKTDGFRDNNDLDHEIYNVFAQADLTPGINLQAEYSYRDTTNGDLAQNFDADDFNPDLDREFRENTARIGARFTPSTASTILLSFIYSDRDEDIDEGQTVGPPLPCFILGPLAALCPNPVTPDPFGTFTVTSGTMAKAERETYQFEGQYLYQAESYNITAGALYSDNDSDASLISTATLSIPVPPSVVTVDADNNTYIGGAYVYGNLSMLDNMVWTAGLSYSDATINFDDPSREDEDYDRFNPKLGLQWQLTNTLDLRAAYFKTVTPVLANKRILEPTQVAGFNQFYDEASGTKATSYGGGLDWRLSNRLSVGGEMVRRKMDSPTTVASAMQTLFIFEDEDEWRNRAYAYWMPHDRWSFTAEVVYDKFESDHPVDTDLPLRARTWSYPVKAQYYHPSGFFGLAGATYVDQEVKRQPLSRYADGQDDFVVTDIAVGYRFPRRQGIVSLAVQNVFDEEFNYQDDSYRAFEDEPSIGPYIPDRTVMARFTLNF